MDPPRTPGHVDRRAAALNGVCLERTIELDNIRLEVLEWPGLGGPLVHVGDAASDLAHRLATVLAPRYRVLSISHREDQPYQVQVVDLQGVCAQFGFRDLVVLAEGMSCTSVLLLAAWYPETVRALVLVEATLADGRENLLQRSLRDCPPDWPRIRQALTCRVLEASASGTKLVEDLEALLG